MFTVRRALISVSDKRNLVDLARRLSTLNIEILSTGGTCQTLQRAGIIANQVTSVTGFPEIMGGRVKTLHPRIHGGLLGRRGTDDAAMREHGIDPIDLLVVNLYPFEATIGRESATFDEAIDNIDIGGPAMIRAAAKNHKDVAVVVDPDDYDALLDALESDLLDAQYRCRLAAKAYAHTASYDTAIAHYLSERLGGNRFGQQLLYAGHLHQKLRYGENPHQEAAFYRDPIPSPGSLAAATQHQGKALSYNNIADSDAALECVRQFEEPACVIVKHANPCGVALSDSPLAAYNRAYRTDPTSAFGGIIAFNRALDATTADAIVARQFVEVILAPQFDAGALDILAGKPNIRVLETGESSGSSDALEFKKVSGGLLVQNTDSGCIRTRDLQIVSDRTPDARQIGDLLFAWKVARFVKSNAVVLCRDATTIGVGAGQMSRVYSTRIAAIKAADEHLEVTGSVLASDAFFPFRDGIDRAAETGIAAIIQPGGSLRDAEVIAAANEHGLAMVFTGIRHFRH